jgi:O-antigen/teichoic acid export membrane protein
VDKEISIHAGTTRNLSLSWLLSILVSLSTFFYQVIIARNVPVNQYSVFVSIITIVNVIGIAFSGFQITTAQSLASQLNSNQNGLFDNFTKKLFASSAILLLMLIPVYPIIERQTGVSWGLFLIVIAYIPVTALQTSVLGQLQGKSDILGMSKYTLTQVICNLSIQIVVTALFGITIFLALLIQILVSTIVICVYLFMLKNSAGVQHSPLSKRTFYLVLTATLSWGLTNLPLILAPIIFPGSLRGVYSANAQFSRYHLVILAMINALTIVHIARVEAKQPLRDLEVRKFGKITLLVIFANSLGVWMFSSYLLQTVYSIEYQGPPYFGLYLALATVPYAISNWLVCLNYSSVNYWLPASIAFLAFISTYLLFNFGRSLYAYTLIDAVIGITYLVIVIVFTSLTHTKSKLAKVKI